MVSSEKKKRIKMHTKVASSLPVWSAGAKDQAIGMKLGTS